MNDVCQQTTICLKYQTKKPSLSELIDKKDYKKRRQKNKKDSFVMNKYYK